MSALDMIKLHNELTRLKQDLRDSLTEGGLSTDEEINKLKLLLAVSMRLKTLNESELVGAISGQAAATAAGGQASGTGNLAVPESIKTAPDKTPEPAGA